MKTKSTHRLERTTFATSRLLDFASEKELVAQTGHRKESWPHVLLKELVDNALDACEDAGVPPEIRVTVDKAGILVEDNGPGIPKETVEGILDFGIRVSSREAYVSPTRGAQGNALKTILAMPFVLDGERGRVEIAARGTRHEIAMGVDRLRQEPVISHKARVDRTARNGSSVRVHWPDSACSILQDAKSRFLQIADDYAWLNPHLTLELKWLKERVEIKATDSAWKKWLPGDPTSPHWYRAENLERLIAAYVRHDADRKADRTVRDFVSEFRGLTSSAKQKIVLDATGTARMKLSELMGSNGVKEKLLDSMKAETKAVKPLMLGVIGKDHLEARCKELDAEMASFQYRRAKEDKDGVPQVAETAFVWLGERAKEGEVTRRLISGVNWSPGIINPFRELGKYGRSLDSILEQQRIGRDEPTLFLLHLACPRVEYTDRGKSAVVIDAEEDEPTEEEVEDVEVEE